MAMLCEMICNEVTLHVCVNEELVKGDVSIKLISLSLILFQSQSAFSHYM